MTQSDPRTDFLSEVETAIRGGAVLRITLGKYRGQEDLERVQARPVMIKDGRHFSFTYSYKTRDEVKNFPPEDVTDELSRLIDAGFRTVVLFTDSADYALEFSKRMVPRLYRKRATLEKADSTHNREKHRFVSPDRKWLHALGITDAGGKVRGDKYDKYRQIDKFIEIIDSLTTSYAEGASFRALDLGSGKSYLTFALYDYLSFSRGFKTAVRGIEVRGELVSFSNEVAQKSEYSGLSFEAGRIEDAQQESVNLLVALHACDTATDDALASGIRNKAEIIVVAPCCHRYLRPGLKLPSALQPVLGHGILEGRLADSLTDGLRALYLEAWGYDTKVFEFISPEHTARNVMITGTKKRDPEEPEAASIEKIRTVLEEFGLRDFYLDRLVSGSLR